MPAARTSSETLYADLAQRIQILRAAAAEKNDLQSITALRNARISFRERTTETIKTKDEFSEQVPPPDLFPNIKNTFPEIQFGELTSAVLESAMHHHGAIILRGMIDKNKAAEMRAMIDSTMNKALTRNDEGFQPSEWFSLLPNDFPQKHQMAFTSKSGAIQSFFSPKASETILSMFGELGLRDVFREYLKDEPCVSFNKFVLRRLAPLENPADWHQDGAFMNANICSLNLWTALTRCGGETDAPGMDLVPKRLNEIVETGKNGAYFDWSVSFDTVKSKFVDNAPIRPTFDEGDALIFDHYNLHSTSYDPNYTQTRYAIETWFFAASQCPINQHPAFW